MTFYFGVSVLLAIPRLLTRDMFELAKLLVCMGTESVSSSEQHLDAVPMTTVEC